MDGESCPFPTLAYAYEVYSQVERPLAQFVCILHREDNTSLVEWLHMQARVLLFESHKFYHELHNLGQIPGLFIFVSLMYKMWKHLYVFHRLWLKFQ